MAKLTITWNPNTESDLAGYTVQLYDREPVDVGLPQIVDGKVRYETPEVEDLDPAIIVVRVRAYDHAGNVSSPAEYSLNPPPAPPAGIEVFFG